MIAIAFALLALVIGYTCRRPFHLGAVDPIKLLAAKEAIWVYTVSELLVNQIATFGQTAVFGCCIVVWWITWWVLGSRLGKRYVATMQIVWNRALHSPRSIRRSAYVLYTTGALITLIATVQLGGGGDNRLNIAKLLRPIEGFTTILLPYVAFLLVSRRRWLHLIALAIICGSLVYTGGRSSLIVILFPLCVLALIGKIVISTRNIIWLTIIILVSVILSGAVNYNTGSLTSALLLLVERVSLDGDVYLLAFPNDLIQNTSTTSLLAYLFGPFLKLVGEPVVVDVNIGSQLAGMLLGTDTPNGPNPHWPIVLMAYGYSSLLGVAAMTALGTSIAILLKTCLLGRRRSRRLPLPFVIAAASFCMQYPHYFFTDPSYALIYLIQAGFVALVWSVTLFGYQYVRSAYALRHHCVASQSLGTSSTT